MPAKKVGAKKAASRRSPPPRARKAPPRRATADARVPDDSVVYTCVDDSATWVPIDSVKPWARNPRRNDRAAEKVAELIRRHGFRVPIIVWRENMTVYAGNTRLKAARLLGMTRVPVSFQDFESEADAAAFALADNRSCEFSAWDEDVLAELFGAELETVDPDATGFTKDEKAGLLEGWAAQPEKPTSGSRGKSDAKMLRCPFCSKEFTLE